jgi:hypothetical protein
MFAPPARLAVGRTWAEKDGDPDFLPRGATNIVVCGFH